MAENVTHSPLPLIFHVDVNSAFLSWEAARRVREGQPDLRLIPSAVGGDPRSRRSIILAKSVPAKRYGIVTGEPVALALQKCPQLVLVKDDFGLYVEQSRAFKAICREYAPVVEEYSIDEVFCDFTGTGLLYPDPLALAWELKERIKRDLGFTVNIGIGRNKLCAKMAGDFEKPDKIHTLYEEEIPTKLWPLPVGDLIGCGRAAAEKLRHFGIRTVGELAGLEPELAERLLGGRSGRLLWQYAHGRDDSPVRQLAAPAKGYSNEVTLEDNVVSAEAAAGILRALADSVATRIRAEGRLAATVTVTLCSYDFRSRTHQMKLKNPTDITEEVYQAGLRLFEEAWDRETPLRLIGLALTDVSEEAVEQLDLFTDAGKREKQRKLDQAVDSIRRKFGYDSLKPGSSQAVRVGHKQRAAEELERDAGADAKPPAEAGPRPARDRGAAPRTEEDPR